MARLKYAMNHGNSLVMMTSSSCFGALEAKYFSNWNGWFYIQARRTPKYISQMNKMFADVNLTVANTKVKVPKIHHWRMGSKAKSAPWNRFPNQKVFTDDRMWGNDLVKLLFKWVSSGAFDWEEEAHLELAVGIPSTHCGMSTERCGSPRPSKGSSRATGKCPRLKTKGPLAGG